MPIVKRTVRGVARFAKRKTMKKAGAAYSKVRQTKAGQKVAGWGKKAAESKAGQKVRAGARRVGETVKKYKKTSVGVAAGGAGYMVGRRKRKKR